MFFKKLFIFNIFAKFKNKNNKISSLCYFFKFKNKNKKIKKIINKRL